MDIPIMVDYKEKILYLPKDKWKILLIGARGFGMSWLSNDIIYRFKKN